MPDAGHGAGDDRWKHGAGGIGRGPGLCDPETLGTRAGSNLFHSFGQFDIGTGESATFSGGSDISRVVGRITGGASTIDGTVFSSIPSADLYLVNPNGIVFGANAIVDVGGAFAASTAEQVVFADGTTLDVDTRTPATLSTAAPSAFGFLSSSPAPISISGEITVGVTDSISISGGGVTLTGATLTATAGDLDVTSVSGAATVPLPGRGESTGAVDGAITAAETLLTNSSFTGGGTLRLRGGDITVAGGRISANNFGASVGGAIDVDASGTLTLRGGGEISAATLGSGDGGAIRIAAGELVLDDASSVRADVFGSGDGSALSVDVDGGLTMAGGSVIITTVDTGRFSPAGDVTVAAETLTMTEASFLGSATFGNGQAGDVIVTAGDIVIDGTGGAFLTGIGSNTELGSNNTLGFGDAGTVTVTANNILLTGGSGQIQSLSRSSGDAGQITIKTNSLVLDNGGVFTSANAEFARTGPIDITVADNLDMRNNAIISAAANDQNALDPVVADAIIIDTGTLTMASSSSITTTTSGFANAGNIIVRAGDVVMDDATISSDSNDFGDAGDVTLSVGSLTMTSASEIFSGTEDAGSGFAFGEGGNLVVNVSGDMNLTDSFLDVSSFGEGRPGTIRVVVGGAVNLDNSRINADSFADFDFGDGPLLNTIEVDAASITLVNDSRIESETLGDLDAGAIRLSAGTILIDGSQVRGRALDNEDSPFITFGDAADIVIDATGTLSIVNGSNVAVSAGTLTGGAAGTLTLTAGNTIVIDGSTIVADTFVDAADPATTTRGSINVAAPTIILSGGATIDAETLGAIDAGDITLTGSSITITDSRIRGRTFDVGNGGDIRIVGGLVDVTGSTISTGTLSNSSGDAGNITVTGDIVTFNTGTLVTTDTQTSGLAGSISVSAGEVGISGATLTSRDFFSGVGASGSIVIDATGKIVVSDLAEVSTETLASGSANQSALAEGDATGTSVTMTAPVIMVMSGSALITQGQGSSGGNITLNASDVVFISDARVATSAVGGVGSGGNITVLSPRVLALDDGLMLAQAVVGTGGNMNIAAQRIITTESSLIDASSQLGVDGQVTLVGAEIEVPNETAALAVDVLDVSALLRNTCGLQGGRAASSLVEAGRGVLPNDGDAPLTAAMVVGRSGTGGPTAAGGAGGGDHAGRKGGARRGPRERQGRASGVRRLTTMGTSPRLVEAAARSGGRRRAWNQTLVLCMAIGASGLMLALSGTAMAQLSTPSVDDPATRTRPALPPLPGLPPADAEDKGRFELPQIPDRPDGPLRPSAGPRFVLREVGIVGATVIDEEALQAVVAPYLDRQVGTADLEQLRLDITRAYIEQGYINSGAVLPDQEIKDGRVVFQVIEGVLTEIFVEEGTRFDHEWIASRLRRGTGPPLDVNELEERIQLLIREPAISRVDAVLEPGSRPGEARLRAKVTDDRRVSVAVGLSNGQSPDVGSKRGDVTVGLRNITGYGDLTSLTGGYTQGVLDFDAYFSIPLNRYDTLLVIDGGISEADIIDEQFARLDIESKTREIGVSLYQPVLRTPGRDLTVFAGVDFRHSRSFLLGQGFSFSTGLDDGEARLSIFRTGVEFTDQSASQVIALRGTYSAGFDFLGGTDIGVEPNDRFSKWLLQGQYVRRTFLDTEVILRGDLQFADGPLFALEQFSIGGVDTVRGYRENLLVRDNGYVLSAEARVPFYRTSLGALYDGADELVLSAGPFFDYGHGWNTDRASGSVRTISSAGFGITARAGRRLDAKLFLAKAFREVEQTNGDLQDEGIHFRVRLQLY